MGHGPNVDRRNNAQTSLVRSYDHWSLLGEVRNRLICTRIESGTGCYGRTELNLRDLRTWVCVMGSLAHARNVGPRYYHYRTTRGGATPMRPPSRAESIFIMCNNEAILSIP